MAGYSGYSMSNNAVAAYNAGEKPISKWTKAAILEAVKEYMDENTEQVFGFTISDLSKMSVKSLKSELLCFSSWHHTSYNYNKTDFYSLDTDKLYELTSADIAASAKKTPAKPKTPAEEIWKCSFLEWSGTRKHPKATEIIEVGIIRNGWFYRADGSKKSITANGFRMIKRVN